MVWEIWRFENRLSNGLNRPLLIQIVGRRGRPCPGRSRCVAAIRRRWPALPCQKGEPLTLHSPTRSLSLSLSLSPTRLSRAEEHHSSIASTVFQCRHCSTTAQSLVPTALPSPPPPCRPTIALARTKVKAYGPSPSPS